jgi:hypothetical protein
VNQNYRKFQNSLKQKEEVLEKNVEWDFFLEFVVESKKKYQF